MDAELRAAAERIVTMATRQLREYEDDDHDDPELLELTNDHLSVARACLAEHPADDGGEIDEAWLLSIGWDHDGAGLLECVVENALNGTTRVVQWHGSGEFFVDGGAVHPQPETKRDVRLLITALKGE